MIEKQDFYHGAALTRLVEHPKCQSIKREEPGYVVNGDTFIFLKYSTKGRSPWRFIFGQEEVEYLKISASCYRQTILGFICGGDGICGLPWREAERLLANEGGWISVRRNFNERYGVAGSNGKLVGKIPILDWPLLVFEIAQERIEAITS